jgi:hypothetical protein
VALELVGALWARRGAPGLDLKATDKRIAAWGQPETSDIEVPNPRWVRRLKQRSARDKEYWKTAKLRPITSFEANLVRLKFTP